MAPVAQFKATPAATGLIQPALNEISSPTQLLETRISPVPNYFRTSRHVIRILRCHMMKHSMNTTKSWFQKARAQTLRASKPEPENSPGSDTSNTASNAGCSNHQNSQNGQTTAPTVEKTLTEFLYKPATVRGLPTMSPEVVSAYNLDWRELEPVLKRIYPGIFFKENLAVEDHYLIYVPRLLTCEERDEIHEIRKQHRAREKSAAGGGQIRARVEHSPDGPRRPIDDDD